LREANALLSTTRLRMELQGRYRDHWSGQVVYDNEFFLGSGRESLAFQAAKELGAPTWLDLDQTIIDSGDVTWRHLLYRGWLRFANDDVEVVLGRQRIALGRAQLWNPTDIFNLIPPLAVEADQRVGVDSLLARVKLTACGPRRSTRLSATTITWQAGGSSSQRQVDVVLMVAKIDRDYPRAATSPRTRRRAARELTETGTGAATRSSGSCRSTTRSRSARPYALVEHLQPERGERESALAALQTPASRGLGPRWRTRACLSSSPRATTASPLGYDPTPACATCCGCTTGTGRARRWCPRWPGRRATTSSCPPVCSSSAATRPAASSAACPRSGSCARTSSSDVSDVSVLCSASSSRFCTGPMPTLGGALAIASRRHRSNGLRSLGLAIAALGLTFLSCAQNAHFLSPAALDFFVESPREDPWNAKISNWQSRNQLDQQAAAQRPVGLRSQDYGFREPAPPRSRPRPS
jgi:hypothetical protein